MYWITTLRDPRVIGLYPHRPLRWIHRPHISTDSRAVVDGFAIKYYLRNNVEYKVINERDFSMIFPLQHIIDWIKWIPVVGKLTHLTKTTRNVSRFNPRHVYLEVVYAKLRSFAFNGKNGIVVVCRAGCKWHECERKKSHFCCFEPGKWVVHLKEHLSNLPSDDAAIDMGGGARNFERVLFPVLSWLFFCTPAKKNWRKVWNENRAGG